MSDRTHDPIRDLESFGTGGIAVNPLEPSQVRRLGDQRRARRRNATMAIAAVAVLAAVIPTALLANRDGGGPGQPIEPTDPTPTPSVITFPGDGVHVTKDADVALLEGTTQEFKSFIVTVLHKDDATCPTPDITVRKYSTEGYALGGVGGCGGYVALWVTENSIWREGVATQDEWKCSDLKTLGIPESFAGSCYEPPTVTTYPGDGLAVYSAADIEKLAATGDVFQSFIGDLLPKAIRDTAPCADNGMPGRVIVKRYSTAGHALGAVSGCDTGHQALWAIVDGRWDEVAATGDRFLCSELDKYDIPSAFIPADVYGGGCDEAFGPRAVQGLRLHMTRAEAIAAGGKIAGPSSDTCNNVELPDRATGLSPLATAVISPTKGIVTFFADPGAQTAKHIRQGSTRAAVEAAYPQGSFNELRGAWFVPLGGTDAYRFDFEADGRVGKMSLVDTEQDCYE